GAGGGPVSDVFSLGFQASAFDVSQDGSVVAVGMGNGDVTAACFHADGTVARAAFSIAGSAYDNVKYHTWFGIDVARAGMSKQIAVTWNYGNFPDMPSDWQTWSVVLDASCAEVAPAHLLEPGGQVGIIRPASVRASDDGHFAFLYEAQTMGAYR